MVDSTTRQVLNGYLNREPSTDFLCILLNSSKQTFQTDLILKNNEMAPLTLYLSLIPGCSWSGGPLRAWPGGAGCSGSCSPLPPPSPPGKGWCPALPAHRPLLYIHQKLRLASCRGSSPCTGKPPSKLVGAEFEQRLPGSCTNCIRIKVAWVMSSLEGAR